MSAVMRVLLFDLNPEENAQYIHTTFKYRNIASNIGPIMMLPAPEIAFADRSPSVKGRRCACVTVNCWADSEMAYELVSELRRCGESNIPHIGGMWTVKLINDHTMQLLLTMAGNSSCYLFDKDMNDSDIDTDIDSEIDDINRYGYINEDKDNDSGSEIAAIWPEEMQTPTEWKTLSSDGYEVSFPNEWIRDTTSPIPEPPRLVRSKEREYTLKQNLIRWDPPCKQNLNDDCDLCRSSLEDNYNHLMQ